MGLIVHFYGADGTQLRMGDVARTRDGKVAVCDRCGCGLFVGFIELRTDPHGREYEAGECALCGCDQYHYELDKGDFEPMYNRHSRVG